jgi:predicted nucleotidyltransferase
VSFSVDLSDVQLAALASVRDAIAPNRWALIGASAIRCRMTMPRPTTDVDFAVIASLDAVRARLIEAGWTRNPNKLQTWQRAGATIDVVPVTEEDLDMGVARLEDGFVMSVTGFDLAFTNTDLIQIRDDLTIPVPRLSVLLLLKMIAWLDRPHERAKDLEDIVFMWDRALPELDDRRWDPVHPVGAAALEYDNQSAFFAGWELGQVAGPEHLHWARRFINALSDDQSAAFMQFARSSRYVGDDADGKLRARIAAFERGLELGATSTPSTMDNQSLPQLSYRPVGPLVRSHRDAVEMLLHDAIDRRRVVQFVYKRRLRIAEPHVLGLKNGRLQILTRQIGGRSSSGPIPDWRRFYVNELSQVELTSETFAVPRRAWRKHSAFDRQIAVVRE